MDDDLLLACIDDNPYYDDLLEAYGVVILKHIELGQDQVPMENWRQEDLEAGLSYTFWDTSVFQYGINHKDPTLSKGGRPLTDIARYGRGIVNSLITEDKEWFESNNISFQRLCGGLPVPH